MAEIATIYIALLNEGTDVWKPVTAEHLSGCSDPVGAGTAAGGPLLVGAKQMH